MRRSPDSGINIWLYLPFMPELPEVETIARGIAKRVTGDVVESVWLGQKKEPLKSPAAEIATICSETVLSGKYLQNQTEIHNQPQNALSECGIQSRHPRHTGSCTWA